MTKAAYLSGRLLLALPGMGDPRFDHSVNVMCVHDAQGAMAIGIGHQRGNVRLHAVLRELDIDPGEAPDREVLNGGPVEPGRGFVLHSQDWASPDTMRVGRLCSVTGSLDILRAIAAGEGPGHWLIALGYAGWAPGQLEGEMRRHGWHAAAGRREILYETPTEQRWTAAWQAEGIDPALLSSTTGSA